MSARCQLTGAEPGYGLSVSHSHVRTARRWEPNIQRRRYFVPSLGRIVRVRLSARGVKLVDRIGIEAAVARIRARGEQI